MSEVKNSDSESKEKQPKRFKQEQYDRLIACSEKGPEGIKEWNEWRKTLNGEIWLEKANLKNSSLQGVDLYKANLRGADLSMAKLQGADLCSADLQSAELVCSRLQGAKLSHTKLQGANFLNSRLQRAIFENIVMDGTTNFMMCVIDKDTDFCKTALENMKIEVGTKILLKYNIRRMNWKDWYKKHRFLKWPVKWFWLMSDYGISTGRIMAWFIAFAMTFSFIYYFWSGCLMVNGVVGDIRGFVHALYFSVVTMTTLGFGDIAANPDSWVGQVVLMVQVILGYVLLGALITRLAVLFTSDGPAGSFTPMDKGMKELLVKLKEDKLV